MVIVLLVALYLLQAIFSFGALFAHSQDTWKEFAWPNRRSDAAYSLFMAILPFGFMVALFATGFAEHGLRYRALSAEESWAAFHARWSNLSHEHWLNA